MLVNEKFKLDVKSLGQHHVVSLKGSIDEDTDFEALKKLTGTIQFNFKEVTGINSIGIRTWVNFLKELSGREITYAECPPLVVRQMNMVPSFVGSAKVLSVFVPYVCDACETEKLVLVDNKKFQNGEAQVPDAMGCENCQKGEMELDGHPKQYFAFAKGK